MSTKCNGYVWVNQLIRPIFDQIKCVFVTGYSLVWFIHNYSPPLRWIIVKYLNTKETEYRLIDILWDFHIFSDTDVRESRFRLVAYSILSKNYMYLYLLLLVLNFFCQVTRLLGFKFSDIFSILMQLHVTNNSWFEMIIRWMQLTNEHHKLGK